MERRRLFNGMRLVYKDRPAAMRLLFTLCAGSRWIMGRPISVVRPKPL